MSVARNLNHPTLNHCSFNSESTWISSEAKRQNETKFTKSSFLSDGYCLATNAMATYLTCASYSFDPSTKSSFSSYQLSHLNPGTELPFNPCQLPLMGPSTELLTRTSYHSWIQVLSFETKVKRSMEIKFTPFDHANVKTGTHFSH